VNSGEPLRVGRIERTHGCGEVNVARPIQTSGKEPEETLPVFIGGEDVSSLNATSHDVEEGGCGGKTDFARNFVNIYLALRPQIKS